MAQITINKALVVQKSIKVRIAELTTLRSEVSTVDRYFGSGSENKVKEPQYDVKAVDVKVAGLEALLFAIDAAIKDSNAVTKIEVEGFDINKVFEPLK